MSEHHSDACRRTLLKGIGTVGTAIGLGGCIGNQGNDGDGGDDGSGGGGGDGGDGGGDGDGGSGDSTTIQLGLPPLGPAVLALNRIRDQTDVLESELGDAGYDIETTVTWEEITLFAAGQVDIVPTLSDVEGTRIAVEREIPVAFHGLAFTNYEGWYVREGSEFDPENSGSVQATLDMLAEGAGTWGNAGWNQGSVVPGQIVTNDQFGYNYSAEESDFTVQEAEWQALPRLLVDGEVDMITNGPPLGTAPQIAMGEENPIKDIYWYQPGLEAAGLDARTANLGNFGTTQEFSDEHPEAIEAFMRAWKQGAEWVSDPDNFEEILDNEENHEALGGNDREEAKIILEFSQTPPAHTTAEPANSEPVMVTDIEIDDSFVETEKNALSRAEELGSVPEGWQDWIEFRPVAL